MLGYMLKTLLWKSCGERWTTAITRGSRVYLAMNILVKNTELQRYFETLSRAYTTGIDGVIVQHLRFH